MISYDENGNLLINDTRVFATLSGGVLSVMLRATDRDTFYAVAKDVGLVQYSEPGSEAVVDAEGEIITPAVPPSGDLVPILDATITELGFYVITPGSYDEEGNELSPPVLDNRFHVNFWLGPSIVARNQWQEWILAWMTNGQAAAANKDETAITYNGVELIDPVTVETRANVLL